MCMFKDKVVIVTGGANGIGRCIADEFRSQGAVVYVIDKHEASNLKAFITSISIFPPISVKYEVP